MLPNEDAHTEIHPRPRDGGVFTYRWGALSVGVGRRGQFGREAGLWMIGAAVLLLVLGVMGWRQVGYGWVLLCISVPVLMAGVAALLQPKLDAVNAPIERVIRVDHERRIIEFCFCPIARRRMGTQAVDSLSCDMDDLLAFELSTEIGQGVWQSRYPTAILRIWMRDGYLRVHGERRRLGDLNSALLALAGERPAPFFQRGWVMLIVIFMIAGAILTGLVLWVL